MYKGVAIIAFGLVDLSLQLDELTMSIISLSGLTGK